MPKRWCQCTGCPACNASGGRHGILFDMDATGTLRCPVCQTVATARRNARPSSATDAARRRKRNTDQPGRPSPTQRGYGPEWRKKALRVTRTATRCHWCGREFTRQDPATADHVIPKARGGTDDASNLVAAHRSCNSRRGGQTRKRG